MTSTSWSLIDDAARGDAPARTRFAEAYGSVLAAYFGHRWRGRALFPAVDDAVQEVFVECFKAGGLLDKADRDAGGGFRPFLYGAAKRVALRFEEGRGRGREDRLATRFDAPEVDRDGLATVFDRAWAAALVRQAAERMATAGAALGGRAQRRVELLRERFEHNRPIREIASGWGVAPAELHHEYATARKEFRVHLLEVVAEHTPGSAAELEVQVEELVGLFA